MIKLWFNFLYFIQKIKNKFKKNENQDYIY